jgi:hypothetical protein
MRGPHLFRLVLFEASLTRAIPETYVSSYLA